jgi:5-methylcytosine-specific restriction endonuclease McrA
MEKVKTYYEKLQDPRWQKRRLEVLSRANFKCDWCDSEKFRLEVHHGYYRSRAEPWEYPEDTLWCLCEHCHGMAEDSKHDVQMEFARIHPRFHEALFHEVARFRLSVSRGEIEGKQITHD